MAWKLDHILRGSNEIADASAAVAYIPTNQRNNAPPYLLPVRVINCYQLGKRDRRSISILDDSNSPLLEIGRPLGE